MVAAMTSVRARSSPLCSLALTVVAAAPLAAQTPPANGPITADPAFHALVGGTTGAGKSGDRIKQVVGFLDRVPSG